MGCCATVSRSADNPELDGAYKEAGLVEPRPTDPPTRPELATESEQTFAREPTKVKVQREDMKAKRISVITKPYTDMALDEESLFSNCPKAEIKVEFKHNGIASINLDLIREHGRRVSQRMSTRLKEGKLQ